MVYPLQYNPPCRAYPLRHSLTHTVYFATHPHNASHTTYPLRHILSLSPSTLNPPCPPPCPPTWSSLVPTTTARKRRGLPSEQRAAGLTTFGPAFIASGQSPRTPGQRVPPVNGGTSPCGARPRRAAQAAAEPFKSDAGETLVAAQLCKRPRQRANRTGLARCFLPFMHSTPASSSTSVHRSVASAQTTRNLIRFDISFLHEAGSSCASPHRLFFETETGRA